MRIATCVAVVRAYNAGGDFDPQHARWRCICGKKHPSKPHITWNCPGTSYLRQRLSLPTNRAAERLLAASWPEKPPAPPALDPGVLEISLTPWSKNFSASCRPTLLFTWPRMALRTRVSEPSLLPWPLASLGVRLAMGMKTRLPASRSCWVSAYFSCRL